jgi:hypothetical protein
VRGCRQREASYGLCYIQLTVSVSFVAYKFPISINLNDVYRVQNFVQIYPESYAQGYASVWRSICDVFVANVFLTYEGERNFKLIYSVILVRRAKVINPTVFVTD